MQIYCPNCALQITIDEGLVGSKGQCPKCSYKFVIDHDHRHPPDADDLGTAPTIKIEREEGFDFDLSAPRSRWVDSNSFVVAMVGLLLLLVSLGVTAWAGTFESQPGWAAFLASLHKPFGHGALALLVTGFIMELMSRMARFAYLQESLTFILTMASLAIFGACISGAFTMSGFSSHAWMSFLAAIVTVGTLGLSFHLADQGSEERRNLLVAITLAVAAVIIVAHLGGSIAC